MKRLLFPVVSSAVVALAMAAPRTVVNPDFENGPITFGVSSVELTDAATRLHADIYGRPGSRVSADTNICLKGRATGTEYRLKSLEGMVLGEKKVLGDSAYVSPVFVFEPLAAVDTVVDFIEPDGWKVSGIRLGNEERKKWLTHIEGTSEGNAAASWLMLLEAEADARVNKTVLVPVRNGRFSYDLYSDGNLAYELCVGVELLNGSWRNTVFFASDSNLVIDIPADSDEDVKISGGEATAAYLDYRRQRSEYMRKNISESPLGRRREELEQSGEMYTPEARRLMAMREVWKELSEAERDSVRTAFEALQENDCVKSEEGKRVSEAYRSYADSVQREYYLKRFSEPSVMNLYSMYSMVCMRYPHSDEILDVFAENYADTLTDNPYHRLLGVIYESGAPAPGRKYTDFTAPDLDGNEVRISDVVGGKVAVIDLWASWCGPCRRHSKELIPLYEKYRDRGFTVVGVARELNSVDDMKAAIARDGYPWLNLVEINDANMIWKKYHAGNSGGRIVLVDRDGTILAVDPGTEEIAEKLASIFGE